MKIPHLIKAEQFINFINMHFGPNNEPKRNRILLAEVLLKLERMEKTINKLERKE